MNQLEKKEPVQAVVIADSFNECFVPFTEKKPLSLLPLVNVPLLDYSLESLNRAGVEEVILFCASHVEQVREYIRHQQEQARCTWSLGMTVSVVSSEGCRCMGDALRDLDAKGLVRGNFILTGVDTVTNANLAALLEEHKRQLKQDKGLAMTVVYKDGVIGQRTGNEVMVAVDKATRRLLHHQRLKPGHKERNFRVPMEVFLQHRSVSLRHGLVDPQIAICSNSALPLFSDNFDFLTRDDFIRGLLINEEILASTIYVAQLPREEYAVRVNNWQSYQIVSRDVANRYVYPLVPDMGVCGHEQQYSFRRNNIYRHRDIWLARTSVLQNDVVIGQDCGIDEKSVLANSVLGRGCKVGKNCLIRNCFLLDGVVVGDNCELDHCIVGEKVRIGDGCKLTVGCILGSEVVLPKGSILTKATLQATKPDEAWTEGSERIGDRAFTIPDGNEDEQPAPADSDEEDDPNAAINHAMRLGELPRNYPPSVYSSSSSEGDSRAMSPVQEDENIFLSEVLESLKRGYSEQSNPDYLILEINSSRYAYNMALSEVNFYVVKAILQLLLMQENAAASVVATLTKLLSYFGSVFKNYIRGRDAMLDCMRALEETCHEEEVIRGKLAQVVHFLYEKDYVSEEAILEWYEELEDESLKKGLAKLAEWLMQSSEEEEDDDDEEDSE